MKSAPDRSNDRWRIAFFALAGFLMLFAGAFIVTRGLAPIGDAAGSLFTSAIGMIVGVVIFLLAVALFLLPTIVAAQRNHHNFVPILLVNLVFGLTLVGWFIALIWATTAVNTSLRKM